MWTPPGPPPSPLARAALTTCHDLDPTDDLLPLCDWRARCFRPQPDEMFVPPRATPRSNRPGGRRHQVHTGARVALRDANLLVSADEWPTSNHSL